MPAKPSLPVLMALSSWAPAQRPQPPVPAREKAGSSPRLTGTITCPITGEQIPPCCCPVKQ